MVDWQRSSARADAATTSAGFALWLLTVVPILGALWFVSRLGPIPAHRATALPVLLGAGVAWAVAVLLAPRVRDSRFVRPVLIAGAIAVRLAVWSGDPNLSDDVHRYVWEGGLVADGVSPYAAAPDSDALGEYRARWEDVFARMNHTDVSAAYPPLAQYAFAFVVAAAGGPVAVGDAPAAVEAAPDPGRRAVRAMRLFFALADLGVLVVLLALLRALGIGAAHAVVWAWSPLVALEYAGSGHFDSLGIVLLVGAVLVFVRSHSGGVSDAMRGTLRTVGYALIGAGAGVKLLPVVLLPFVASRNRGAGSVVRSLAKGVAWSALTLVLISAPVLFLEGGATGLLRGVSDYALRWESFSLLFRVIDAPISYALERDGSVFDARRVARAVVFLLWCAAGVWTWRRRCDAAQATFWMLGAFLVLTPTLHPWYLTWLVPFLALRRSLAWTLLIAAAPVLYWPLTEWHARGEWIEPVWLWPAVALPFLSLLAFELRAEHRAPA